MAITRFKDSSIVNRGPKYDSFLAGLPYRPVIGTATDGGNGTSVSVAFTGNNPAGSVTYTALSSPGNLTATGPASPITVTGLTSGTAYTFQVKAGNSLGDSAYSASSNSVTPVTPTAFESIATATGTGSSGTITFSSIPGTYQHLQIRLIVRDTNTGGGDYNLRMNFNSDSGSNYTDHNLRGNGTTVTAGGFAGNDRAVVRNFIPDSVSSNTTIYGVGIVDIHDYASTTKYKTIRSFAGKDLNGSGLVIVSSNLWMSTSAISSITFTPDGTAYATGSTFALYGIR